MIFAQLKIMSNHKNFAKKSDNYTRHICPAKLCFSKNKFSIKETKKFPVISS